MRRAVWRVAKEFEILGEIGGKSPCGAKQTAGKGQVAGQHSEKRTAGAEAHVYFALLAARSKTMVGSCWFSSPWMSRRLMGTRLKSRPVTKPLRNPVELSFSAICKARADSADSKRFRRTPSYWNPRIYLFSPACRTAAPLRVRMQEALWSHL